MSKAAQIRMHVDMAQRFSMALARAQSPEELVAGMLAACVVSMNHLGAEGMKEVKKLIDNDHVRVLR